MHLRVHTFFVLSIQVETIIRHQGNIHIGLKQDCLSGVVSHYYYDPKIRPSQLSKWPATFAKARGNRQNPMFLVIKLTSLNIIALLSGLTQLLPFTVLSIKRIVGCSAAKSSIEHVLCLHVVESSLPLMVANTVHVPLDTTVELSHRLSNVSHE